MPVAGDTRGTDCWKPPLQPCGQDPPPHATPCWGPTAQPLQGPSAARGPQHKAGTRSSSTPTPTSSNAVLAGGPRGMMVSVVFLRFSGKARSIVVWTTGGSSWCPVVENRHDRQWCSGHNTSPSSPQCYCACARQGVPGQGVSLLTGGTGTTTVTTCQLCPLPSARGEV